MGWYTFRGDTLSIKIDCRVHPWVCHPDSRTWVYTHFSLRFNGFNLNLNLTEISSECAAWQYGKECWSGAGQPAKAYFRQYVFRVTFLKLFFECFQNFLKTFQLFWNFFEDFFNLIKLNLLELFRNFLNTFINFIKKLSKTIFQTFKKVLINFFLNFLKTFLKLFQHFLTLFKNLKL